MLLFRIVFSLTLIALVWSKVSYSDIDIQLYADPEFESAINYALNATKMYKVVASNVGYLAKASSLAVGSASGVFTALQTVIASEGEAFWKETLIKSIADETQRSITKSHINIMHASMKAIYQSFRRLNESSNLPNDSKRMIVHDINNEINKIINAFNQREAIFRQYPQLVIPPLSALASIITVFVPIVNQLEPELAQQSFLSCKLKDILYEYRFLAVNYRLNKLRIWTRSDAGLYGGTPTHHDLNENKCIVRSRTYNQYGYNGTNDGSITCRKKIKDCDGIVSGEFCLIDQISKEEFITGDREDANHCVTGYMEILRHRVEKAFEDPIDLMTDICSSDVEKHRSPTGTGYFTIVITTVVAKTKQNSDKKCDPWYSPTQDCDPYVKIFINSNEVFQTPKDNGQRGREFYLFETFTSSRILKPSSIKFEVWDYDGYGHDDILLLRKAEIRGMENTAVMDEGSNRLDVVIFFKEEYQDD